MVQALLEVQNLSKRFTTENGDLVAVNDVSFRVQAGEVYGLIGLSGAGKSTLVRCLNRLEEPDTGHIWFEGRELASLKEEELARTRRHIGMIFQQFNLFSQKTVFDNVAYPLLIAGKKKRDVRETVERLLGYVDLADKSASFPAELSGGQKQRVAIARALITNPTLLLSDEATSALDPETTLSILNLLRRTVDDMGVACVLITHQMEVAKAICDRIGVLEDGVLIEEGTVEELFLAPRQTRTRRFIQTLRQEDEEEITAPLQGGTLYRIAFPGETARHPIVADLIRKFAIDVNLLAGNINAVRLSRIGYLIVELTGEEEEIARGLQFLTDNGVHVEEVK